MFQCINCTGNQEVSLFQSTDYITHDVFRLMQCTTCRLIRTEPQTTNPKYYPDFYYGNSGNRFPQIIENLINRSRTHRAEIVNGITESPGIVVDIGCGRGIMLSRLKKHSWNTYGIEISRELLDHLKKQSIHVFNSDEISVMHSTEYLGQIDIITSFHSLEHMRQPTKFIRDSYKLLKPGGRLIIEVPNFSSTQSSLSTSKWFHNDVPRHLYHFQLPVIIKILTDNGFKIIKISTFSFEYGIFGFAQSILNLISPTPNFVYLLLLKSHTRIPKYRLADFLLVPIIVPLIFIGGIAELISSLFKRGSIIRIITQK